VPKAQLLVFGVLDLHDREERRPPPGHGSVRPCRTTAAEAGRQIERRAIQSSGLAPSPPSGKNGRSTGLIRAVRPMGRRWWQSRLDVVALRPLARVEFRGRERHLRAAERPVPSSLIRKAFLTVSLGLGERFAGKGPHRLRGHSERSRAGRKEVGARWAGRADTSSRSGGLEEGRAGGATACQVEDDDPGPTRNPGLVGRLRIGYCGLLIDVRAGEHTAEGRFRRRLES